MWALGLCCCGPVTVNLLFLSRCEMYSTVKSHTGFAKKAHNAHTQTHTPILLHPILICWMTFICFIKLCFYQCKPTLMAPWLRRGGQGRGGTDRESDRWISTWPWCACAHDHANSFLDAVQCPCESWWFEWEEQHIEQEQNRNTQYENLQLSPCLYSSPYFCPISLLLPIPSPLLSSPFWQLCEFNICP